MSISALLSVFRFLPVAAVSGWLFSGCADYEREQFRLLVHKPYVLQEWPDSVFVAGLDSLFRNEPLKRGEPDNKAELTIVPGQMMPAHAQKAGQKSPAAVPAPEQAIPKPAQNAEQFAQRFMTAMELLRSDPDNSSYGALHPVRAGEDLPALLVRVYGPDARQLPRFVLESSLRSVNPGVDPAALHPGEALRLPRLR